MGRAVPEGDDLALVPVSGDVVSTKISPEAASQQLIDNLLGMHLSISRPVNGLIKYFIFFMVDCNHSLRDLPFPNNVALNLSPIHRTPFSVIG
jgi:hypothetical protein